MLLVLLLIRQLEDTDRKADVEHCEPRVNKRESLLYEHNGSNECYGHEAVQAWQHEQNKRNASQALDRYPHHESIRVWVALS